MQRPLRAGRLLQAPAPLRPLPAPPRSPGAREEWGKQTPGAAGARWCHPGTVSSEPDDGSGQRSRASRRASLCLPCIRRELIPVKSQCCSRSAQPRALPPFWDPPRTPELFLGTQLPLFIEAWNILSWKELTRFIKSYFWPCPDSPTIPPCVCLLSKNSWRSSPAHGAEISACPSRGAAASLVRSE